MKTAPSSSRSLFTRVLHLLLAVVTAASAARAANPAPSSARAAEALIHIKYSAYIRGVLNYADGYLEAIADPLQRANAFAANESSSAPSWNFSRDSFEKIGEMPTRVPNWFPKNDLALFRDNIDLLKANALELRKLADELKADGGKQYAALKPKLEKLVADAQKASAAIRSRSVALAEAAETELAAGQPLGPIQQALRDDLARAGAINALLAAAPEPDKADAAAARALLEKVRPLLQAFKESTAKNAARSHRALIEELLEKRNTFYTDSQTFIRTIEGDILPDLESKNAVGSGNQSRLRGTHDNLVSAYNQFVVSYNYSLQKKIAIER